MQTSLFFVMIRRPPRSTRTDTLFPYTTLFRAGDSVLDALDRAQTFDCGREFSAWIAPFDRNRERGIQRRMMVFHSHPPVADDRRFAVFFLCLHRFFERQARSTDRLANFFSRSEEHTSELQSLMPN